MNMKLQNIIFPEPGICMVKELYYHAEDDVEYDPANRYMLFKNGGISVFDTYFNSITAEKWEKYTRIGSIKVTVKIRGSFKISLLHKERLISGVITRNLGDFEISTDAGETKEFTFSFDTQSANGMFCFSLLCLEDNSVFYGGYYSSNIPKQQIRDVKIGVIICTFKRERFIQKNINSLSKHFFDDKNSDMYNKLEIFVIDNGKTLDIDAISTDKIHVFHNNNTGGSGGFTRGMIEVLKLNEKAGFSHVLLMDDDVIIEPESIVRTYTMLSILKDEYRDTFVGGAMLRLDNQYIQVESGGRWNAGNLVSLKRDLDLRKCEPCLYNEIEEKADFNAWWYCTIPMEVIRHDNLALPLFIRGDDVEFGIRNMKHLILLNGICVWHEPFENKYSSTTFYYILRNRLIDNSIHSIAYPKKHLKKELAGQVLREIFYYRYKNADLLMRAVSDFLKGPDWLLSQDGALLHKEIMDSGYKMKHIEEFDIPFTYSSYENSFYQPDQIFIKKIFRLLTFNGLFLRAKYIKSVPAFNARPINFYRVKRALNYDYTSRKGFVTEKSISISISQLIKMLKLIFKVHFKYKSAVNSYRRDGRKLMNIEFWGNYLGINQCSDKLPQVSMSE